MDTVTIIIYHLTCKYPILETKASSVGWTTKRTKWREMIDANDRVILLLCWCCCCCCWNTIPWHWPGSWWVHTRSVRVSTIVRLVTGWSIWSSLANHHPPSTKVTMVECCCCGCCDLMHPGHDDVFHNQQPYIVDTYRYEVPAYCVCVCVWHNTDDEWWIRNYYDYWAVQSHTHANDTFDNWCGYA